MFRCPSQSATRQCVVWDGSEWDTGACTRQSQTEASISCTCHNVTRFFTLSGGGQQTLEVTTLVVHSELTSSSVSEARPAPRRSPVCFSRSTAVGALLLVLCHVLWYCRALQLDQEDERGALTKAMSKTARVIKVAPQQSEPSLNDSLRVRARTTSGSFSSTGSQGSTGSLIVKNRRAVAPEPSLSASVSASSVLLAEEDVRVSAASPTQTSFKDWPHHGEVREDEEEHRLLVLSLPWFARVGGGWLTKTRGALLRFHPLWVTLRRHRWRDAGVPAATWTRHWVVAEASVKSLVSHD